MNEAAAVAAAKRAVIVTTEKDAVKLPADIVGSESVPYMYWV